MTAVTCVPALLPSVKSIVNTTACSVSPACITLVAVQLSPLGLVTESAAFPSIITVGVLMVSDEVNDTVTVSPAFASVVSSELFDTIDTGDSVGAIPSDAVALPEICAFPTTSDIEPTRVTSGVSSVVIVVDSVIVTTPGDDSVAEDTVWLATVKSAPATVVPSRSSLNVTSMVVVVTVAAESSVGGVISPLVRVIVPAPDATPCTVVTWNVITCPALPPLRSTAT